MMKTTLLTVGIVGLLAAAPVWAVTQTQLKQLDTLQKSCYAAREAALKPIRAQRTQACIEQQIRSKEHCKRYYTTYGNVTPGPSGAPQYGLFWDLPECQTWLTEREKLEASGR
jgi:hypothetical protein